MADYFTPTIVEPEIPDADMTPLERLLLSHIFETEQYDGVTYLFSEQGPSDMVYLDRAEVMAALTASENTPSSTNDFVREQLAAAGSDASEIEFDMSVSGWPVLFQDILSRSATIPYVTVKSAFTCSKMRSDGFGGMAMLITADDVMAKSTHDIIEEFEAKLKAIPAKDGGQVSAADNAS